MTTGHHNDEHLVSNGDDAVEEPTPLELLVDSPVGPHSGRIMDPSTHRGVGRIYLRFIVLATCFNGLLGLGLIAFDVADSLRTTRAGLKEDAELLTRVVRNAHRDHPERPVAKTVARTASQTGADMGLFGRDGALIYASSAKIAGVAQRIFNGRPQPGIRYAIDESLGSLSGAWLVSSLTTDTDLLVIVEHRPEDEGLLEYMTIGAGVLGLGLALTFGVMLAMARWLLHRPLQQLVHRLTGALARDVQRRRRAERRAVAARMETERHLAFRDNLIAASDSVGIVATDREGTIQIYNRAAERILGYRAADMVNKQNLKQLWHAASRPADKELPLRSLIKPLKGEEFVVDREGNERLVAISRSEITDRDHRHAGNLLTFTDVTQRRSLEAELQLNELQLLQSAKMASLGEMATGVAHELNQPLNNIGLLASRVARRLPNLPNEDAKFCQERISLLQGQVQRASRIIDQLRSFGRRSERKLEHVQVPDAVRHILGMLGEQFHRLAIEIRADLPPGLPAVHADGSQLEQVLLNLLLNARDALDLPDTARPRQPDGRLVRISAHSTTFDDGRPAVRLDVSDNGPGMSGELIEHIFQPFFTTKDPDKGTGLGLSISYGLIRGFDGTLTVDSRVGEGTTFTITLPSATSDGNGSQGENTAD